MKQRYGGYDVPIVGSQGGVTRRVGLDALGRIQPGPAGDPFDRDVVCGYSLDSGRVRVPDHVLNMPHQERDRWLRENNLVLPVGGGSWAYFEMMHPYQSSDGQAVTAASQNPLTNDAILTLPANFFDFAGKKLWFRAMGKQSNVVTTPGTYLFRLFWNGTGGTALVATGAITPNPVAVTDNLWYADFWVRATTLVSTSTTGMTLTAWGVVYMANEIVPTTNALWQARYAPPGGTALADVASLNPQSGNALTLAVTPSVATGSITCRDAWIVALN